MQLHCLHQMLDSISSGLLLTPVGPAWIWHFSGFWLLEGKARLGPCSAAAAGVLGCSRDTSIKSFGFLSAPWWGLGTARGLLGRIRLIIPRLLTLRQGVNKSAVAIPDLQAMLDPVGIRLGLSSVCQASAMENSTGKTFLLDACKPSMEFFPPQSHLFVSFSS